MIQIAVIQQGSDWTVLKGGLAFRGGLRRSEALALAERLCFQAEEHDAVEMLVQDYSGELRAAYSGGE